MISSVLRLLVVLAVACGGKKTGDHPPAQIVDLTGSTAELTRDFDAHSGEARFVTTLSPA